MRFATNGGIERMRISSAGDVGIGTTPSYRLHVLDSAADIALFSSSHATTTNFYINNTNATANNTANLYFGPANAVAGAYISAIAIEDFSTSANRTADLAFYTRKDGTFGERVRIDSSGNLLVGTTNSLPADNSVEGIALSPQYDGGIIQVSRTGQAGLTVNRRTSDGDIQLFKKDGTTVGSIGVSSSDNLYIAANTADHAGLLFGTHTIYPMEATTLTGGTIDLGASATKFKDLYLSGKAQADTYQFSQNSSATGATEAIYRPTTGQIAFKTNSSEAMRIDTTSPSSYSSASELVVDTGVGGGITVVSDSISGGYGALFFADGTTGNEQYRGYVQYNHNNGGSVDELLFGTAGSEAMRIDSSGRVGIGASPNTNVLLHVQGEIGTTNGTASDPTHTFYGDPDTGMFRAAVDTLAFSTAGTERIRLDSSGKLTYGAISYGVAVDPDGSGGFGAGYNFETNGGSPRHLVTGPVSGQYLSSGSSPYVAWYTAASSAAGTAAAERARIDTSGRLLVSQTSGVGIGGTPADVNGTEIGPGYINLNRDDTASATQIQFGKNGSVAGSIVTTTSTTYNTTSDRRAKENIADADDAGAIVDAIQVRKFDWKGDGTHQRYGMIAQELLESAPEVVHQPEDPEEMMGVDYSKLVPMLVKEVQSLRARVAQLEGEN
jgi:hypothetical protein